MSQKISQFNELQAEVSVMVRPMMSVKVVDKITADLALKSAISVKDYAKKVDALRKSLVDPLNAQVKEINSFAKGVLQPLEAAEIHIKSELAKFEMEQEKIRQEEMRKAEIVRKQKEAELLAKQEQERLAALAEIEKNKEAANIFGDDECAPVESALAALEEKQIAEQSALFNETSEAASKIDRMGVSNSAKVWKCEVENIDMVPKEFLFRTLNEKAVLAVAKSGVVIPGVKVWQETSIRIGRNTRVS